jgi:hypothetical protein
MLHHSCVFACRFSWILAPLPVGGGASADPELLQALFNAAAGLCKVLAKHMTAALPATLKHTKGTAVGLLLWFANGLALSRCTCWLNTHAAALRTHIKNSNAYLCDMWLAVCVEHSPLMIASSSMDQDVANMECITILRYV